MGFEKELVNSRFVGMNQWIKAGAHFTTSCFEMCQSTHLVLIHPKYWRIKSHKRSKMLQSKHIMHIKRAISFGVIEWSGLTDSIKLQIIKQPDLFSSYMQLSKVNRELHVQLRNAATMYSEFISRSEDVTNTIHNTDRMVVLSAINFMPVLFGFAEEELQVDMECATRAYGIDPNALHAYENALDDWDVLFLQSPDQNLFCNKRFMKVLAWAPQLLRVRMAHVYAHLPMNEKYHALKEKERIRRRVMALYVQMRITSHIPTFDMVFQCIQNMQINAVVLETDIATPDQEHTRFILVDAHNIRLGNHGVRHRNNDHTALYVMQGSSPLLTYYVAELDQGVDINMLRQVLEDKANLFVGDKWQCVAHTNVTVSIVQGEYQWMSIDDDFTDMVSMATDV